jgi:protein O-mannosyl-transferase
VGFDEIMSQLRAKLDYPYLAEVIEAAAKKRVQAYKEQFQAVQKRLEQAESQPQEKAAVAEVTKAIAQTVEQKVSKKEWLYWYIKAQQERDPAKREAIFQQGIAENPDSAKLANSFANFLQNVREDYDKAEQMFQKAIELDRKNADYTGNYAQFLQYVQKDYDKAEQMFQKALELDPKSAIYTGNYALFLDDIRKNYDKAEQMYQKALELDPKDVDYTGSYACFLADVRKDYDKAEQMHLKALELDPKHANATGNYAAFLLARGRMEQASAMVSRAWDLCQAEPRQATAEVALYRTLLAALNSENINAPLGQVKTLLQQGFTRGEWSFDEVLSACAPKLTPEQNQLFRAVADAILDDSKRTALEALPAWQAIQPVPLK